MRTKIVSTAFFAIICVFVSYAMAAGELTIEGPAEIDVQAGTTTSLNYNIINNGDTAANIYIQTSGDCVSWTNVMTPIMQVQPNSQNIAQISITIPSTASMIKCDLDVSATSLTDTNSWDQTTTTMNIETGVQTGKTHYQSDVEPEPVDEEETPEPAYGIAGVNNIAQVGPGHLGVDIVFNPKLQTRGYVLSDDDSVCVGDTISVDGTSLEGEWYQKGGPTDSPPMVFVDDLLAVRQQIYAGTYKTETETGTICAWKMIDNKDDGPNQCVVDAALICGYECSMDDSGSIQEVSENEFEVTGEGEIDISLECPVDCLLFVDREPREYKPVLGDGLVEINIGMFSTQLTRAYGILDIQPPGTLSSTTKVTAVRGQRPAELSVQKATFDGNLADDQPVYARIIVENTGDIDAIIDDVTLNVEDSSVVYMPDTIRAGETAEILVKANAEDVGELEATFEYRTETLGCLNTREFTQSFGLGSIDVSNSRKCTNNADCEGLDLESPVCCDMMCRDQSAGSCDDFDGNGKFEWEYY